MELPRTQSTVWHTLGGDGGSSDRPEGTGQRGPARELLPPAQGESTLAQGREWEHRTTLHFRKAGVPERGGLAPGCSHLSVQHMWRFWPTLAEAAGDGGHFRPEITIPPKSPPPQH